MSDYLFADPDGVEKIARPYDEQAQRFVALSATLADLRARFKGSWGNDSYSQPVTPKINQAIMEIQRQVDALGQALGLYHEGLVGTSKSYREAECSALEAGQNWSKSVTPLKAGVTIQGPALEAGVRIQGPVIIPEHGIRSDRPAIKSDKPTIEPGPALTETRLQDQHTGAKPEELVAFRRERMPDAIVTKCDDPPQRNAYMSVNPNDPPQRHAYMSVNPNDPSQRHAYMSVNPNDPPGPLVDPHGAPHQLHHSQVPYVVDPNGVPVHQPVGPDGVPNQALPRQVVHVVDANGVPHLVEHNGAPHQLLPSHYLQQVDPNGVPVHHLVDPHAAPHQILPSHYLQQVDPN
ncbi:MAG: hypothetical protein QOH97_3354, partial [Actinoplanes sp.]|nr:hypothetical protein [Actinoplanes sp.]